MLHYGLIKGREKIVEVICDVCGKSCDKGPMWYDPKERRKEKVRKILGLPYVRPFDMRSFEYSEIKANWGYCSDHDTETWKAQVCEECTVELSKKINFEKTYYM